MNKSAGYRLGWLIIFLLGWFPGRAQQHAQQNHGHYVAPSDSLVRQKLARWQDVKFGLPIPWESCMTLGEFWSYQQETFKSARQLVQTLVDILAKNGNLLLNVAPGPDGEWLAEAYTRLAEIGTWLRVNGESIYNTKPVAPYRRGPVVYQTYLPAVGEMPPVSLTLVGAPARVRVTLLGYCKPLKTRPTSQGLVVTLSAEK